MIFSIVAIGIGAALGALLRWAFSLQMNALFPFLPLGTLASNLVGGYLIGLAVGYFGLHPDLPPQWRLFAITGFLGGLTTFSTFSAEVVAHLTEGRLAWALAIAAVHVLGSVCLTVLGLATVNWLRHA
jgi:CrcB protein